MKCALLMGEVREVKDEMDQTQGGKAYGHDAGVSTHQVTGALQIPSPLAC